ncbi:unnamed protein product [Acanthoscelides obtectus]|uniref:Uncharacterized protein n=1 Tax=Acanthoscelides obtectus TaxID=200917 RepID=A0A9P0MLG8_ACAOB|nr:unnamed protein product [Acanthoscelides obtectus]CAK1667750.1 hypothetical protein AOBTE_LOCUS26021 [Acanthoscelides obtectus]
MHSVTWGNQWSYAIAYSFIIKYDNALAHNTYHNHSLKKHRSCKISQTKLENIVQTWQVLRNYSH